MIINKLHFYFQFVSYLFTARSKYRVHSPYVYEFYTNVILARDPVPGLEKIEKIRSRLLKNKSLLEITDFGSGASKKAYRTRFIKVSTLSRRSSISRKQGDLLYRISKVTQAGQVLEMGTAMGISTMYLAFANLRSRIVTMEGCAMIAERASSNFRRAGLENIELIQGNFDHSLHMVLEKFDQLDLVFIDGNHRREPTLKYFTMMLPKLHSSSVVIIHDIHWSKAMSEAWKEICNHEKVSITIDLFRLGIVLFKEDIAKENFVLRF